MRGWRRPGFRFQLTFWYAGSLAVVLVLYAGGVFGFVSRSLFRELDRSLHEDYERAEETLECRADGRVGSRVEPHHEEEGQDLEWVEVRSPQGALLYRSPPAEPGADRETEISGSSAEGGYSSRRLPDGSRVRLLAARTSLGTVPVVIQVARSEEPIRRQLRLLLLVLGLGLPAAVGIAALGGYGLARRALAPVAEMAERARCINAERLGERLPVSNPRDELGRLAAVFNETLARLEKSFQELRRFTADASHELRTPLTAIRSVGEVGLRKGREGQAYREVIASMLEETDRLGRLVDSLLTLSRADSGGVKLAREETDLTALAREVAGFLGTLAEEKRQAVLVEAEGPVQASVDPLVLRQAVINLVHNAIKYSPEGAPIRIQVRNGKEPPTIQVVDQGPGIAREHQERVFDRFYRVDPARSRELGGHGLGLSIALWAVEAHGGRIELVSEEGAGSSFRIVLPASRQG
jgi:heavy metal sensor kinase